MFHLSDVDLIFAEDEIVFREIATPAIAKAGITKVHEAENGTEALEHLISLQDGPNRGPIIFVLDVYMPEMDGVECAKKVKELAREGRLKRIPFMICCSASINKLRLGDDEKIFHIQLPKPLTLNEIRISLDWAGRFWVDGCHPPWERQLEAGEAAAAAGSAAPVPPVQQEHAEPVSGGGPTGTTHNAPSVVVAPTDDVRVDIIVANDEMICRMLVTSSLPPVGEEVASITEVETVEELVEAVNSAQGGASSPLLLLLGNPMWLPCVEKLSCTRQPYVVCTSGDLTRVDGTGFDAILPSKFTRVDIQSLVSDCRRRNELVDP